MTAVGRAGVVTYPQIGHTHLGDPSFSLRLHLASAASFKGKGRRLSPSALCFASKIIPLRLIIPVARRCVAILTSIRVVRVYGTNAGSVLIPIVVLQYTHIRWCRVRVQVRIDVRGVTVGSAIATSNTNHRKQTHND
jgi:hypothetical protein